MLCFKQNMFTSLKGPLRKTLREIAKSLQASVVEHTARNSAMQHKHDVAGP